MQVSGQFFFILVNNPNFAIAPFFRPPLCVLSARLLLNLPRLQSYHRPTARVLAAIAKCSIFGEYFDAKS